MPKKVAMPNSGGRPKSAKGSAPRPVPGVTPDSSILGPDGIALRNAVIGDVAERAFGTLSRNTKLRGKS